MTVEMGPRDVDLSLDERFAARITQHVTPLTGLSDSVSVRFDPRRATLSLSGESEYTGDEFKRGLLVALVYLFNVMLAVCTILLTAEAAEFAAETSPVLGAAALVPFLFLSLTGITFAFGSLGLMFKTDVIDHTTEPAPEEIQDLKEQFVGGEIDKDELGERAAEVWER